MCFLDAFLGMRLFLGRTLKKSAIKVTVVVFTAVVIMIVAAPDTRLMSFLLKVLFTTCGSDLFSKVFVYKYQIWN